MFPKLYFKSVFRSSKTRVNKMEEHNENMNFSVSEWSLKYGIKHKVKQDFLKYLRILTIPTFMCGAFPVSNVFASMGKTLTCKGWGKNPPFLYSCLVQLLSFIVSTDYLLSYGDPNILLMDKLANLGFVSAATILGLVIRLLCLVGTPTLVSLISSLSLFQEQLQASYYGSSSKIKLKCQRMAKLSPNDLPHEILNSDLHQKNPKGFLIMYKFYWIAILASFLLECGASMNSLRDRFSSGSLSRLNLLSIPQSFPTLTLVVLQLNQFSLFMPSLFAYLIIIHFSFLLIKNFFALYNQLHIIVWHEKNSISVKNIGVQTRSQGDKKMYSNNNFDHTANFIQNCPLQTSGLENFKYKIELNPIIAVKNDGLTDNFYEDSNKLEDEWKKLQNIFSLYDQVVGPWILTFIIFNTFILTVHLYSLASTTSRGYFRTYGTIVYLIACVLRILVIADVGHTFNSKVRSITLKFTELYMDSVPVLKNDSKIIRLLGSIQEWKWKLEPGGFFILNRTLITSVMEKCVTYLIVLLQFNLALKDTLLSPIKATEI